MNYFRMIPSLAIFFALATAGCGSRSPAGSSVPGPVNGASINGTVASDSAVGLRVSVSGSGLSTPVDSRARFTLSGVPAGKARLQFNGPGVDAHLDVSGLVNGRVRTLRVRVSGSEAVEEPETEPSTEPSDDPNGPDDQQGDQQGSDDQQGG